MKIIRQAIKSWTHDHTGWAWWVLPALFLCLAVAPARAGLDDDGLTDEEETFLGTNPGERDTDDDGIPDLHEILGDPTASEDPETQYITSPLYSMAHFDPTLTNVLGQAFTPPRSLDLAVTAASAIGIGADWVGVALPVPSRFETMGASGWTFETWVRPSALDMNGALISYQLESGRVGAEIGITNGLAYARFQSAGGIWFTAGGAAAGNLPLVPDRWQYVVGVWDPVARSLAVYVNDTKFARTATLQPAQGVGRMHLGGSGLVDAPGTVLTAGMLDEVRIWDLARSADLLRLWRDRFLPVSPAVPPQLLAYFRFDDAGETIEDFSQTQGVSSSGPNHPYALRPQPYGVPFTPFADSYGKNFSANVGTSDWVPTENAFPLKDIDDTDGDLIPNWWEHFYTFGASETDLDPSDDLDGDGLNNQYEYWCRTNPFDQDTDNNGATDGLEDMDGEGLNNAGEQRWLANPQLPDTDDDGWTDREEIDRGTSPRHPMSRPDFISSSFDASANPSPATGVAIPEPDRFQFGQGGWTVEAWYYPTQAQTTGDIFTYVGLNGESLRLGLTNGVPFGQIFTGAGILAAVGGTNTVPPLALDEWHHLAFSFSPLDNTFRLYRDGFLLIAQFTLVRPNIAIGDAFLGRTLTAGYVDELRVWAEARTAAEIARWQYELIPSFEIVDAGPFSGFLYTQELLPEQPPAPILPTPGWWPTIYRYTDDNLLRLYYRFDDSGPAVEDFSQFQDPVYYLPLAFGISPAGPVLGMDDADGDSIPDWWIDLNNLSHWLDRFHGTAVDVRKDLNVDGTMAEDYSDPPSPPGGWLPGNLGPWDAPPAEDVWPEPEPDVGFIIRDFVAFGSFGGALSHEENFTIVQPKSRILHDSGKYVALVKYFVLPIDPKDAVFNFWINAGVAQEIRVNGVPIGMTTSGSTNVTSLLRRGRNQLYIRAEDTAGATQEMVVQPPGFWLFNPGGDPPALVPLPWPPQTFTWPLLTMKIDSSLVVDGNTVIARGDETKFDPRAVWHGRVSTEEQWVRFPDLALRLPEHPDYGLELDSDGDGVPNYIELLAELNPKDRDTNNNGIPDSDEDFDGDTLLNLQEVAVGTDLRLPDTDDDGLGDAFELAQRAVPTDGNSPQVNRAARLTPAGRVVFPKQSRFAQSSWSVELRVRPNTAGGTLLERTVGTVGALPLINYGLALTASNTVTAYFSDIAGQRVAVETPEAIPATGSNWTHVAATYDLATRTLRLYLDAQLVASLATNRSPVTYGPGGAVVQAGPGYDGLVDEVRFWRVARTQPQIESVWRGSLSGSEADLVGYYRFDDGGLTAQDSLLASRADWTIDWRNAARFAGPVPADAGFIDLAVADVPQDADSDGDGLPDWWELLYGLDPFDPNGDNGAFGDPDGDGLWNISEYRAGLDPSKPSTFDDGVTDGLRDSDGDGLNNRYEQDSSGSRLDLVDTDDDGYTDWEEVTGYRLPGGWLPAPGPKHILSPPPVLAAPGPTSNPLRSVDPLRHRSGHFDGSGLVRVQHQERHALLSWTLQAWVQPDAGGAGVVLARIVTNTFVKATAVNYELGVSTNTAGALIPYTRYAGFVAGTTNPLAVRVDGTQPGEILGGALTTMELAPGVWTHLAATYDHETHTLSLYINGELASYRRDAFAPWGVGVHEGIDYAGEVTIGGLNSVAGVASGFRGHIDDAMIIGGAASAQRVLQGATTGIPMRGALLASSRTPPAGVRQLPIQQALTYDHAPTRVLVRFRDNVTPAQVGGLAQALGTRLSRSYRLMPIHVLTVTDGATLAQKLAQLRADPNVTYAEPDYRVTSNRLPNDNSFDRLWGMQNTGQTGGTPGADIDARTAWDRTVGSRDVVVAIIDEGLNYLHPDLAANAWVNPAEIPGNGIDDDGNGFIDDIYGYDFYGDGTTRDGDPMDEGGHGSHTAGTVGATGNNGLGIVGVNWDVQLMGLRFLGPDGGLISDAVAALDYALQHKVRISNNSWGGFGFSQSLYDAIAVARQRNHLFVASAGNFALDIDEFPMQPAGFDLDNIISVAASDHNDAIADFSNYGARNVDLAAPGVSVYSTSLGSGYESLDGTSMAAPHVAGVAALLLSLYPDISYEALKLTILNSVDPVDAYEGLMVTAGRLNAGAAVTGAGIVQLYLAFDDGGSDFDDGQSVEDFTVAADWDNEWSSAGRFVGGAMFSTNSFFLSAVDSNGDGIPDWWAESYGFDPRGSSIADLDSDGDGLNNFNEYLAGTHPQMQDSNGNGTKDGDEDLDGDGLTNRQEQALGTHPLLRDTDDDGLSDGEESNLGTDALTAAEPQHLRAMSFDGQRRLRVRQETVSSMVDDWTLEMWVRTEVAGQNALLLRRAEKFAFNGLRRVDFALGLTNGVPYVEYAFRRNGILDVQRVVHDQALPLGRWVHVGAVREALDNQLRLFVEGKRIALRRPATIPTETHFGSFETVMGGGDLVSGAVVGGFNGLMDAVRVWGYARTSLEVQDGMDDLLPEFVNGQPDGNRAPTQLFNFDDGGSFAENSRYATNWLSNWPHAAQVEGGAAGAVSNYLVLAAYPPIDLNSDDDGHSDYDERGLYLLPLRSEIPYSNRFVRLDGTGTNMVVVDELVDNEETMLYALTNWTVETWVRLHAVPAGTTPLVRRVTNVGGWRTFELGVKNVSGAAVAYARFDRADGTHASVDLTAPGALPIGLGESAWTHLATTFNSGRFSLFVNGGAVRTATIVGASPMALAPGDLLIGSPGLTADLQEIRVWKVPRTEAQIADSYRQTLLFSTKLLERSYIADGDNAYLARPTADAENGYIYDHSVITLYDGLFPIPVGRETHKFVVAAWVKMTNGAAGGIVAERKVDIGLLPNTPDWRINHSLRITGDGEPQAVWEGQVVIATPIFESNRVTRVDLTTQFERRNVASEVDIRDGKWHHLAIVGDSYTVKLFIDGRMDAESLSYYQFRAIPAPSFETFYFTYPPIDSVLRVADDGIEAIIDEVQFWNEDIDEQALAKFMHFGLTKTDIQQGLSAITPIPEFAVDDGAVHQRLVSYVTLDGAITPPFVPDSVNESMTYRMTPLPRGNELALLASDPCPVKVDRLRALVPEMAGFFAAVDGGTYLENYLERNNLAHAGRFVAGARFDAEPFAAGTAAHIMLDSDGDGIPDWWESLNGLDPSKGAIDGGMWADDDLDGLHNLAEYQAWAMQGVYLDINNPDSLNTGRPDFYGWHDTPGMTNRYRIFGEIYTDMDGMEEGWEVGGSLDPMKFDAHEDADGDGWSNRGEFHANVSSVDSTIGTAIQPDDNSSWPVPMMKFIVRYKGFRHNGPLVINAYDRITMDGVPSATYVFDPGGATHPRTVVTNAATTGYIREGQNWFFGFYDTVTADGTWNPGEPAGMAVGQPLNIGFASADAIELDLRESQPNFSQPDYENPGYARFAWPAVPGANAYQVTIVNRSVTGSPVVFSREIAAPRTYVHEQDYLLNGQVGLPQAGYEWFVFHTLDNVSLRVANDTHVVVYPASLAAPVAVTPNGTILRYALNHLQWNQTIGATYYRLQIARDVLFSGSSLVTNELFMAPGPAANGRITKRVPLLAGDAGLTNGTYYWRVQAGAPGLTSPWNTTQSFGVNLADGPAGPYSIRGDIVYFGKVTNGNFVVQAFTSRDFSLLPVAQVTVTNRASAASWPTNRIAYALQGLAPGQYYVRAFLDQDSDRRLATWESTGFRQQTAYLPLGMSAPPSLTRQDVLVAMSDTDNDKIADDWEYQHWGSLAIAGSGHVRGYTDTNNDGVNDFESYAATPMNVNPVVPFSAGPDGVPMRVKVAFGLAIDEDLYFDVSSLRVDAQGRAVMRWFALPGGGTKTGGAGGRGTQSKDGVEVRYQVQYAPNPGQWTDVVGAGTVIYDATSNQFEFVHSNDFDIPGFYRYKVLWMFQ